MMTNKIFEKTALHSSTISVSKPLMHEIGLRESIILTELLSKYFYWEDRAILTKDNYFICTVEELLCNTLISKHSQINCINKLVKLKLVTHENRGMPPKRYFTFTEDNLYNFKPIFERGQYKLEKLNGGVFY